MSITTDETVVPEGSAAIGRLTPAARRDAKMVMYWLTLGAAAGGLGGGLIGGIGGRLGMFLLRLTSDSSIRGIESDDGFTIGRFGFSDSLQLLAITAIMGCVFGLIVVAGWPFFPKRGMPFAWAVAGAAIGGGLLIHQDGVDFTVVEPHWLAVTLFIAIPGAGAGLIAWLTQLYRRFWLRKRKLTVLAALPAIPIAVIFPIALAALAIGFIWFLTMQFPQGRTFPGWRPARVAAMVVFCSLTALGLVDVLRDARAIV